MIVTRWMMSGMIVALVFLGLFNGVPAGAAAPSRPDLVIAVQQIPDVLDPGYDLSNIGDRIYWNVFDTLIARDYLGSYKLVPALATSWRRIDDKTLELSLRHDVKFQNGDSFTADDVAFTFGPERMSSPNDPAYGPTRAYWGNLDRVEVIDPYTVRIVMKTADPLIEQRLAGYTSQVINKRAYQQAQAYSAWARSPIGTGPFKVREFHTGEYILLDSFDGYWGGTPAVQTVKFVQVPEVSSRIAGLASGEYDIITDIPVDQLSQIRQIAGAAVAGGPVNFMRFIVYDTTNPVLSVPMRQALSLAINRDLIVQTLWRGVVGVPNGPQWPGYGNLYVADWPKPVYDPALAKRLIAQSGYHGQEIVYRVQQDYYENEVATGQILVAMWREIGINARLQVVVTSAQVFDPQNRGIRNSGNTEIYTDPSNICRYYGPAGVVESTKEWSNAAFDEQCRLLTTSILPVAQRKAIGRKMLEIWSNDDPPAAVLYQVPLYYGVRNRVHWKPIPVEFMDLRPQNLSVR